MIIVCSVLTGTVHLVNAGEHNEISKQPDSPALSYLASSPPDIRKIRKRGKLIVAMHGKDQPPFFMHDKKGTLIGIDVELAQAIASEFGVNVEFNREAKSFDEVVDIVAEGKADIGISKLSLTLDRAKKVRYTRPYLNFSKAVLLNRLHLAKKGATRSLNDIFSSKEVVIGAISDSSYEAFAKRLFPDAGIFTAPSWSGNIIPEVAEGKILAAFRDEFEVRRVMLSYPNSALKFLAVFLKDEGDPIMMVVPYDSIHMHTWLNLFLEFGNITLDTKALFEQYAQYVKVSSYENVQN